MDLTLPTCLTVMAAVVGVYGMVFTKPNVLSESKALSEAPLPNTVAPEKTQPSPAVSVNSQAGNTSKGANAAAASSGNSASNTNADRKRFMPPRNNRD